jgi:hypothetical protein
MHSTQKETHVHFLFGRYWNYIGKAITNQNLIQEDIKEEIEFR